MASKEKAKIERARVQLIDAIVCPVTMQSLSLHDWDAVIQLARNVHLIGQLAELAGTTSIEENLPPLVVRHLAAVRVRNKFFARTAKWDVERMLEALEGLAAPVVLLKGAAFQALDLPFARGRWSVDADLLVPKSSVAAAESTLRVAGWQPGELDSLNAEYFRRWLHEVPPLIHEKHGSMVDLHHAIIAPTDPSYFDPAPLFENIRPIPGAKAFTLAPVDILLHAVIHTFRNGYFKRTLREFMDIRGLTLAFKNEVNFWIDLTKRAEQFGMAQTLWWGLHFTEETFPGTIPAEVFDRLSPSRPGRAKRWIAERLVRQTIVPETLDRLDNRRIRAANYLAHWPLPRLRAVATPLFWTKRFPQWFVKESAKP